MSYTWPGSRLGRTKLPRRVALLLALMALALAALFVAVGRRPSPARPPAPPRAAVRAGALPPPGEVSRARPSEAAARPARCATPMTIVRHAATALWAFDWEHAASGPPAPLRPWVTAALWDELADSPGAPAETAALVHERDEARVVSVTVSVADHSAAGLAVAVSAEVAVSTEGRPPTSGREDAEMLVVPTPAGCRIAGIDA